MPKPILNIADVEFRKIGHGSTFPGAEKAPEKFAAQAAEPQVKMIEIKLSQGAKPGHGGVLPGPKVTAEIAAARGVPIGRASCRERVWTVV